ncbi:MAG: DUF4129 domain-containing protein [Chloroflexota bacterium]
MVSNTLDEQEIELPKRNLWADFLFRPALLTIMITCISISIVAMGRAAAPSWWGGHILIAMVLVAIESIYSFRVRQLPQSRGVSEQRYRLAEFGILAILIKLITFIGKPMSEIGLSITTMLREPSAFFSLEYIVTIILALLVWIVAYGTMADFEALYDPITFRSENITAMQKLTARFYWGGGILVFFSGLSLVMGDQGAPGLLDLARIDRSQIGGVVLNALVYFVLGLVMLSQVRLTSLMTRWFIQKVDVSDGLGRAWAKYGFTFLLIIALLVLFLPTRYSLGLFDTTVLGLAFIFGILLQIVQLILFLLTVPLVLLASIFGDEETINETPTGGDFGGFPQLTEEIPPDVPWYDLVQSMVFWLIFLFAAIYFIRTYLADHPELLDALKKLTPMRWLMNMVTSFISWVSKMVKAGTDLIPKAVDLQTKSGQATGRKKRRRIWSLNNNLSAREQILYYYLNVVKRADEVGLTRKQNQTPYEYEPKLGQSLPEVENDVNLLTEAFVHARYSRDGFDDEHAAMVKTIWQRVQTAVRDYTEEKPETDDEASDNQGQGDVQQKTKSPSEREEGR